MSEAETVVTGYYFSFERGSWAKWGDAPAQFRKDKASGTSYVGWFTKEQSDQLDAMITKFIEDCEAAK